MAQSTINVPKRDELKLMFYMPVEDKAVVDMLKFRGHSVTFSRDVYYDIALFTGGSDVHPFLYGEKVHPTTSFNIRRDMVDINAYRSMGSIKPKVGICRGGQFLNVMSGGSLYQHVDKHAINVDHEANCLWTQETVPVSSTHHQMMRAGFDGTVMLEADESTNRFTADGAYKSENCTELDVEAVYYHNTNSFCYQPHPEMRPAKHPCQEYFFDALHMMFGTDVMRQREQAKKE